MKQRAASYKAALLRSHTDINNLTASGLNNIQFPDGLTTDVKRAICTNVQKHKLADEGHVARLASSNGARAGRRAGRPPASETAAATGTSPGAETTPTARTGTGQRVSTERGTCD